MKPAIYCIKNLSNNKVYIGSATRGRERWRGHRSLLRRNKHFSCHLQYAWNKYGEENFEFSIIESISYENLTIEELQNLLILREKFWIKKKKATNPKYGYNSRLDCSTNLGIKWSEESKKRFSESKKGKVVEYLRQAVIDSWKKPEFRAQHKAMMQKKREQWSEEKINAIKEKRSKSLAAYRDSLYQKFGKRVDPNTSAQVRNTFIKNGHSIQIYTYLPNGKFFKKFDTAADALRMLGKKTKNSSSIITKLDKSFFGGLLFSKTKYETYPVERLQTIKNTLKESIVTDNYTGEQQLCYSFKEVHETIAIPRNRLYEKNFTNKKYIYRHYTIELIAPIIGDDNSKVGEFIENLYKDNNEPSLDLNGQERCND